MKNNQIKTVIKRINKKNILLKSELESLDILLTPYCDDFLPISQIVNADGLLIGIAEKKEGDINDTDIETKIIPIDDFLKTIHAYKKISLKIIENKILGV